jgi:excisionase family DNA binding protein
MPTAEILGHQYVDLTGAAQQLHLSQRTIRRLIADGTLPAYRLGGRLRIRVDDLQKAFVPA